MDYQKEIQVNTIHTYTRSQKVDRKITKQELLFRVELLEDVLQRIIDRMAEKEKVQLGVLQECNVGEPKFVLYQQEITKE